MRTPPVSRVRRCQLTVHDRFEYVDERMKKYEFWASTAKVGIFVPGMIRADDRHKECRDLKNFSSTSAIVTALSSPTIKCLTLTCESKTAKQILHQLAEELSPTGGSYRDVIQNAGTKELIPWLGTIGLFLYRRYLTPMFRPISNVAQLHLRPIQSYHGSGWTSFD